MRLFGDKTFCVSQRERERERGALKAPPVSLSVPTGVFEAGTLNSYARRKGSPKLVMGSQNVAAAIWSALNSS